jgi:hypothetical protein
MTTFMTLIRAQVHPAGPSTFPPNREEFLQGTIAYVVSFAYIWEGFGFNT